MSQLSAYTKYGQSKGLSPIEYLEEVADFSNDNKQLNFVQVIRTAKHPARFA